MVYPELASGSNIRFKYFLVGKYSILSAEFFLTLWFFFLSAKRPVHQKGGLSDDDFEPYLSPQARLVRVECEYLLTGRKHREPPGLPAGL